MPEQCPTWDDCVGSAEGFPLRGWGHGKEAADSASEDKNDEREYQNRKSQGTVQEFLTSGRV